MKKSTIIYSMFLILAIFNLHYIKTCSDETLLSDETDNQNYDNECSICFEEFGTNKITLICGHAFCKPCIDKWSEKTDNCPTCKRKREDLTQYRCYLCKKHFSANEENLIRLKCEYKHLYHKKCLKHYLSIEEIACCCPKCEKNIDDDSIIKELLQYKDNETDKISKDELKNIESNVTKNEDKRKRKFYEYTGINCVLSFCFGYLGYNIISKKNVNKSERITKLGLLSSFCLVAHAKTNKSYNSKTYSKEFLLPCVASTLFGSFLASIFSNDKTNNKNK